MIINFLDKVICHANLDSFIPFGHAVSHADLHVFIDLKINNINTQ